MSIVMLIVMLSVSILNVVMLKVVAPSEHVQPVWGRFYKTFFVFTNTNKLELFPLACLV
jgi:hypothetical protein